MKRYALLGGIFKVNTLMLIFIFFSVTIVIAHADSTGWMYHGDANHSGVYKDMGISTENSELWNNTIGYGMLSSLAISDGVVYGASINGNLCAINCSTGTELWNDTLGDANFESTPAVANGLVFIGNWNGSVYALNVTSGVQVWNYTTGGSVTSSPAVSNGTIYVGSYDRNVYALNATTGARIWSYRTGNGVGSSPAIAYGIVYVGSSDGTVYAINASTGSPVWRFKTGESVWASPAVANGIVYIGSFDDRVYALNAITGSQIWCYTTGGFVDTCPAIANDTIYFGSDDGNVYALNATTGVKIWGITPDSNSELGNGHDLMRLSPIVANGALYIQYKKCSGHSVTYTYPKESCWYGESVTTFDIDNMNTTISALDAKTGTQLWNLSLNTSKEGYYMPVTSSPVMANGVLYIGTGDGKVHAIGKNSPIPTVSPLTSTTPTARTEKPLPSSFIGIEWLIMIGLFTAICMNAHKKR